MRSIITAVIVTCSTAWNALPASAEIPWSNDLRSAHAQAKQQGKQMLLHFYTENCHWCDRLEAGAFQSPALAQAIQQSFVPVKIHAGMNPTLAKTFRVSRFPTDVIVTPDGTVLSHGVSPQDPNKYIALLAEHAPAGAAQGALVQTPATPPATYAMRPNQPATPTQPPRQASLPAQTPTPQSTYASGPLEGMPQPQANPYAPAAGNRASRGPATGSLGDQPAASPSANAYVTLPPQPAASRPAAANISLPQQPPAATDDAPAGTDRASEGFALPTDFGGTAATTASHRPENSETPPATDSMTAPPAAADSPATTPDSPASTAADKPTVAPESTTPPIALQGFCPVALVDEEAWKAGSPDFGLIHLGQLYLFTDQAALEKFQADPEPYTPVMNGNDVVLFFEEHRVVEGRRDWGLLDPTFNRIFLFASEETMNHFHAHHQDYVRSAIMVTRQAAAEANSQLR